MGYSERGSLEPGLEQDRKSMPCSQRAGQPACLYQDMIALEQNALRLIETHSRLKKELASNATMDEEMKRQLRARMLQVSQELAEAGRQLAAFKQQEALLQD